MKLEKIAKEINKIIDDRRKDLELTFIEDTHTYYMKDTDGTIKSNFPSVSKIINSFHSKFDADKKALEMSGGDPDEQQRILNEWKSAGERSTNMGSRVHYLLEQDLVSRYGNYKDVREPIFYCEEDQIKKSDNMVIAGKKYLDLMGERKAVLIDTEMIMGDPELGYVGQSDKTWLMYNKSNNDYGIVITDWKTNQPKNFETSWYTKKMFHPFEQYDDTALGHYYIQLPSYGKLFMKMLKGSKYENIKFLGSVVVLLKENNTFVEYKVPTDITNTVFNTNLIKYLKK